MSCVARRWRTCSPSSQSFSGRSTPSSRSSIAPSRPTRCSSWCSLSTRAASSSSICVATAASQSRARASTLPKWRLRCRRCISSTSPTATSSPRTCCSTPSATSASPILASPRSASLLSTAARGHAAARPRTWHPRCCWGLGTRFPSTGGRWARCSSRCSSASPPSTRATSTRCTTRFYTASCAYHRPPRAPPSGCSPGCCSESPSAASALETIRRSPRPPSSAASRCGGCCGASTRPPSSPRSVTLQTRPTSRRSSRKSRLPIRSTSAPTGTRACRSTAARSRGGTRWRSARAVTRRRRRRHPLEARGRRRP
mmetsp:Transcript_39342/g.92020  ORF Transcript_39342/g.92020 Transcript_39342/m.92020 type:complete len:313 (-) Transcript_39342:693-1631(-)